MGMGGKIALAISGIVNVACVALLSWHYGVGPLLAERRAVRSTQEAVDQAVSELTARHQEELLAAVRDAESRIRDAPRLTEAADVDEAGEPPAASDPPPVAVDPDPWAKYREHGVEVEWDEYDNDTTIRTQLYIQDSPISVTVSAYFEGQDWPRGSPEFGYQFHLSDPDASVYGDELVFLLATDLGNVRLQYEGEWAPLGLFATVPFDDLPQIAQCNDVRLGWWTHKGPVLSESMADLRLFLKACTSGSYDSARALVGG